MAYSEALFSEKSDSSLEKALKCLMGCIGPLSHTESISLYFLDFDGLRFPHTSGSPGRIWSRSSWACSQRPLQGWSDSMPTEEPLKVS